MRSLAARARAFIRKAQRRGPAFLVAATRYYGWRAVLVGQSRLDRGGLGRHAYLEGRRRLAPSGLKEPSVPAYFARRTSPAFHFSSSDIPRIVLTVPEVTRSRVIGLSDRIMSGRFVFRGIGEMQFSGPVDWNAAYDGNMSWRWDLNRHSYFADLAAASHYTGRREYARRALDLWAQWIAANPPGTKKNWAQPFEVAARLNNWIWAFFLLAPTEEGSPQTWDDILLSLCAHAAFLSRSLEYHWPNNHLLLEAKALAMFSVLFPEFDPGGRFRRRGIHVLLREADAQVLSDGSHSELCTMYHRIVAGELHEAMCVLELNNVPVAPQTAVKIRRMANVSRALTRCDGTGPLFGDSAEDDSYLRFDLADRRRSHLSYWLCQRSIALPQSDTGEPISPRLTVLPDAGYIVVEDPLDPAALHLTVDAGPFIRNPAPDHGHCDALSFELHAHGRPILIDPGIYYPPRDGYKWRQYFRGTSAHNTVMIDGHEQGELIGWSEVGQTAEVKLLEATVRGKGVVVRGTVRPYWAQRGDSPTLHDREFIYHGAGELSIRDTITGEGRVTLAWHFHFASDLCPRLTKGARCEVNDELGNLLLMLHPEGGELRARVACGETDPLLGWSSRTSATVHPSPVVVYSTEALLPYSQSFRLVMPSQEQRRTHD